MIKLKRVYDDVAGDDGFRVLVERLWPRGISKERAALDSWMKEIAPSADLRKWFSHDPQKWEEFRTRYRRELDSNTQQVSELLKHCREGDVTLIYAASDNLHNAAIVLKEYMEEQLSR